MVFSTPTTLAAEDTTTRILVLHSYHPDFRWSAAVHQGITSGLSGGADGTGLAVDLRTEYLDAKRFPNGELHDQMEAILARKYRDHAPDLIISVDDDALQFLFARREQLFGTVPVVFGGLDAEGFDARLLSGRREYTGIVERLDLVSTLELITEVHGTAREIVVVNDQTQSGLTHRGELEMLDESGSIDLPLRFMDQGDGLSFAELLDAVESLPPSTPIFFAGFYLDRTGTALEPEVVIPELSAVTAAPIYAHNDELLGLGICGGRLLSGTVHGRSLAELAKDVVEAGSADGIPVRVESSNRVMADFTELRAHSIPLVSFPADTEFINVPARFFDRYRNEAIVGVSAIVGLFVLIVLLAIWFIRARRAEHELEQAVDAKDLLMREMNHRVKNNLSMITSLIRLKGRTMNQVENVASLDDVVHQIDAIRIVHDNLYKSTDLAHIRMRDYVGQLIETVFASFSDERAQVSVDVDDIGLPTNTAVPMGMIINEAATNAIKHGFSPQGASLFQVTLRGRCPDRGDAVDRPTVELAIFNSGTSIPTSVTPQHAPTLGMRLITALTEQLGGTMSIRREGGTTLLFSFPCNGGVDYSE